MNEKIMKEKIKNILGNKYKKIGLTEEEMIEFGMMAYKKISKEIDDEKMRELFVDVTLLGYEDVIKILSWKIEKDSLN